MRRFFLIFLTALMLGGCTQVEDDKNETNNAETVQEKESAASAYIVNNTNYEIKVTICKLNWQHYNTYGSLEFSDYESVILNNNEKFKYTAEDNAFVAFFWKDGEGLFLIQNKISGTIEYTVYEENSEILYNTKCTTSTSTYEPLTPNKEPS